MHRLLNSGNPSRADIAWSRPKGVTSMEEQRVLDFLDDYAGVLSRGDAHAMASRWNVPSLVVGGGQALAVSAASETEQFFGRSFAQYHESGVLAAVPTEQQVTVLSPTVAAVTVRWLHEDGEGNRVGVEDAFYVVAEEPGSGELKVVFYTPIER